VFNFIVPDGVLPAFGLLQPEVRKHPADVVIDLGELQLAILALLPSMS
jgi:hypothetical protein